MLLVTLIVYDVFSTDSAKIKRDIQKL